MHGLSSFAPAPLSRPGSPSSACLKLQSLPLFRLHLTVLLQSNGLDLDKSASFDGLKGTDLVHAALRGIILGIVSFQRMEFQKQNTYQFLRLTATAQDNAVALVKPESDLAVDTLLRRLDAGLQELSFGGEIEAAVQGTGPTNGDKLVSEGTDFAVKSQTFEIDVRISQDRETWCLITTLAKVRRMLIEAHEYEHRFSRGKNSPGTSIQ